MRILALDASSSHVGWIVWNGTDAEAHGTIKLSGEQIKRLPVINLAIADLLRRYAPDGVAVEAPAFSRTSELVSQQRVMGAILLSIETYGLLVTEVAPNSAKKALAENGRAKKPEMIKAATLRLGHAVGEHIADALGVALVAFPRFQAEPMEVIGAV